MSAPQPTLETAANTSHDPTGLVPALSGRLDSCWDRLDDVVDELAALYDVEERDILDRVHRVLENGAPSPTWDDAAARTTTHDGLRP
jgi:hypothetical protein